MKARTALLMLAGALGLLLLLFGGCYTELSTVRNDNGGDEEYANQQYQDDTSYVSQNQGDYNRDQNEYYDNNDSWNCRPNVGYSYYYPAYFWPSFAFSAAYYDPWFYDSYWGGYYPGYYPGSYYGYPYYYGYAPYYHYPYYASNYGYAVYHRGGRTFGSTRGSVGRGYGDTRMNQPSNGGGGFTLPTAGRIDRSSGGTAGGRTPAVTNTGRRAPGNQRAYTPRSNRAPNLDRGTVNRGGGTRGEVRRYQSPPQYHPRGTYAPSPGRSTAPPPGRSGNRDAGSSRGYAPSHSPAPSPAPRSAPSGGGRSGNPRGRG